MNSVFFTGLETPSAWLEFVLGFAALTMASALPGPRYYRRRLVVASWVSPAPWRYWQRARASFAVMDPKALAAAFSQI